MLLWKVLRLTDFSIVVGKYCVIKRVIISSVREINFAIVPPQRESSLSRLACGRIEMICIVRHFRYTSIPLSTAEELTRKDLPKDYRRGQKALVKHRHKRWRVDLDGFIFQSVFSRCMSVVIHIHSSTHP